MKRRYGYKKASAPKRDLYADIAAQVQQLMEEFGADWKRPWAEAGLPLRVSAKVPYRGVNTFLLGMAAFKEGFASQYWGTFQQWLELKHPVQKGQHSPSFVVFYKQIPRTEVDASGEEKDVSFRVAKAYPVFNGDQVEGWVDPVPEGAGTASLIDHAEAFVKGTRAVIVPNGSGAFYVPSEDKICMPPQTSFIDTAHSSATENYYSALLHELIHWTGHITRLDRGMKGRFGSEAYAGEELVAELGSAFLCAQLRITPAPRPDHAQYIAAWLKKIASDPRAFTTAASKAEQAVEFLQALQSVPAQTETSAPAVNLEEEEPA